MNQYNYFIDKEKTYNQNLNINLTRKLSKEKKTNTKPFKRKSFNENELSEFDQYNQINKDSFVKGLSLVFIYFSVIIYSVFYMLTPDKNANLIFEGNANSVLYNYSLFNNNNKFYKLDSIRVRENLTMLEISKDFRYEKNDDTKNNLLIKIIFSENLKIINKIVIINSYISKEINIGIKIYHYYRVNDFPFWLALLNDKDIMNITSDNLNNFSFDK